MSGPEPRIQARDEFDPRRSAREAKEELDRTRRAIKSARECIAKGVEAIRRSQELIARIPDKW